MSPINASKNIICLLLLVFLISTASCRKNYSKEGNALPEILHSMTDESSCNPCPYYIQVVELKRDTYFMVVPKQSDPGIICDWFTGASIYDANSVLIDPTSDLFRRILSTGDKKEIVFDCP